MILADKLAAKGSKVFGWDIEWEMDWSVSRSQSCLHYITDQGQRPVI